MIREQIPRGMEYFELDEDGCGIAFSQFQAAVQVWCFMRPGPQATVRDVAQAFQVTDAVAWKAADEHPWMFVIGPDDDPTQQLIEHDGE